MPFFRPRHKKGRKKAGEFVFAVLCLKALQVSDRCMENKFHRRKRRIGGANKKFVNL